MFESACGSQLSNFLCSDGGYYLEVQTLTFDNRNRNDGIDTKLNDEFRDALRLVQKMLTASITRVLIAK